MKPLHMGTTINGQSAKHGISVFSKTPIHNVKHTITTTMKAITFDILHSEWCSIAVLYRC